MRWQGSLLQSCTEQLCCRCRATVCSARLRRAVCGAENCSGLAMRNHERCVLVSPGGLFLLPSQVQRLVSTSHESSPQGSHKTDHYEARSIDLLPRMEH